jgi:transcriptional regulator with XRE-family HTH domain
MRFADKLRELRQARDLSEAKLAEASGLPFATVHNYGLGRRRPSFAAVVKMARALGVTCEAFSECEDILTDEGQLPPAPRPRGRPPKQAPHVETKPAKSRKRKAK